MEYFNEFVNDILEVNGNHIASNGNHLYSLNEAISFVKRTHFLQGSSTDRSFR